MGPLDRGAANRAASVRNFGDRRSAEHEQRRERDPMIELAHGGLPAENQR